MKCPYKNTECDLKAQDQGRIYQYRELVVRDKDYDCNCVKCETCKQYNDCLRIGETEKDGHMCICHAYEPIGG